MKKLNLLVGLCFTIFLYSCGGKNIKNTETPKELLIKESTVQGIDTSKLGKYPQIPKEVLVYLKENMNEYEVINAGHYSNYQEWKKAWQLGQNDLPFFLKLDFNGDKKEDYALLLMKGQKMRLMLLLNPTYQSNPQEVEFLEMKLHDYHSRNAYEENMMQFMIKYQDKGETYGIGNAPPPVHLKYESIQFIKFGAASSIFYYEDSKIKRLYTGT